MKKSFVLYADQYDLVCDLEPAQKGWLLDAIFKHAGGEEVGEAPDGTCRMAFKMFRAQMDRDCDKWETTRQARAEAGRKGGKAKAENAKQDVANLANASNAKQDVANLAVNVTDTVTVTVTGEDKSSLKKTTQKKETNRGTRLENTIAGLNEDEKREWFIWPTNDLGWDYNRTRVVWDEFRDYWKSQPGAKGVKLDWFATWRNWCRRANERGAVQSRIHQNLTAGQKHAAGAVLESAGWATVAAERRGQPVRRSGTDEV